ncbi:MAG TPA: HD domain-containing phosphohydrolase [Pirellulaceae bacterium]|nr:HD domain-containing phosphohydrolase [Pirellulaceae bacterium]
MQSMKVLVAEDDFVAREILCNALRSWGYDVTAAENGEEALRLFDADRYRLVITDWEMPRASGLQFCREIRRRSECGYVYVIVLTSRGRSEEIVEGMSAGADDFIVKPFDAEELRVRLRAGQRILSLETREAAIFALAKLAESRDPDTGRHLERVQRYSRALVTRLVSDSSYASRIEPDFAGLVFQTSALHDIGKVGIPDSILLKPGRLSPAEFEVMKTHTTIGAETLETALEHAPGARFLEIARDIALSHHERYNGKGYPYGLAGEDIPLAARVVAVADVYDALTSKRIYKEASTHLAAKQTLMAERGAHFDPVVLDAFLDAEREFLDIAESLREEFPAQVPQSLRETAILP